MMTLHIPAPEERGRPWSGASLRYIAGGIALALAVTLVDGTSTAIADAPRVDSAPKKPAATQAMDIPSARVAARLSGKRVEALSERTETSTTWANKNGSLTTELTAGPIRFEDKATGEWKGVDLGLVRDSDGSISPKAHPQGLQLAGKTGTRAASLKSAQSSKATDLVTLGEGDEQITLQWKGGLPTPKLDGTRATYAEAVPGADVIVEATRTGYEQFVEIQKRPPSGDYTYTLPLKAKSLKVKQQADGSLLFTDKKNKKRAVMPAPAMWDAKVDKISGEHVNRAAVSMKVVQHKGSVDLVLTPDAKFLADPETTYPVTVDPSTSALGNVFDTYVQQGETVDWSADTELDLGHPGTTNSDGTPRTARSFITWNTAPISDALVSNAKLSLFNFHSGNTTCTAQPWEVWSAGKASTASRWTSQPTWTAKKATSTETKGNPSCTAAPDGWINADVTDLAQEWASAKNATSGMGLRATSETNTAQWKRINSANNAANPPKLTVTYNYRPRTGTKQEAGPPYFSYGGAYTVNTLTPTLRDTFVDSNGDKVNGTFQIFDSATDTQVGNVIVSPYVPSGQVASVKVPAGVLTGGKTYKFRTNPYDGAHYNVGWSAWKTFTVDAAAPLAPTKIVSTDYPTTAWVKGTGQAGTFTVTPPAADHNWLEWSLDGVTWTKVATNGAAGDKPISITPARDGTHTLQVRSVDKADNKSEPIDYTFHAGPGGFIQPAEGARTARRLPLLAEADGAKYDKVSFSWRRSEADPWVKIPVGNVTEGGTALSAWPVALSGGKNAALTWNATSTVDPDGSVQIKADFTGPNSATGASQPLTVVVDRNADGAASEEVGPGSVNLLTGDYVLSSTDASAFEMSISRTAASRTPDAGAKQAGQAPIFGKEWSSGTVAEATDSEYSHLSKTSDTAVAVVESSGDETYFSANAAKNGWIPEPGSEDLTLKGSVSGTFTLSDTEGTVTEFTKPDAVAENWQVSSTLINGLASSATTVVSETTTVDGKKLARPKRIIAPTSAVSAAACTTDPATKGCRVLELVYATTTTATGWSGAADFGDFKEQVKEVRQWSTEPGAANATSKAVATYRYDASGRLRQQWNPNLSQASQTQYSYDAAGRVNWLDPGSELPWDFTYGKAGTSPTSGDGMLLKVSRAGLKQGTADVTEGQAVTSIVYDVPLTGSNAPYPMGANDAKTWGQTDIPADATAVFPADSVPTSHTAASLTAADYKRAAVHYLGVSAQEVNVASPGGHITTTEYDRYGNTVREMSAANRAIALGLAANDRAVQEDLGIAQLSSAERAELLSTRSTYSDNGIQELEEFGSLRRIDLTQDLKSGTTTLVPAGTSVTARTWSVSEYDAGRPTDGTAKVKYQNTKVTVGAQVREHPSVQGEARTTQTVFDWTLGLPVKSIQDPGGLALTTATEYDALGRTTKQIPPGSTGSDAATMVTTYWSGSGTGACAGHPEWADAVCTTGPAGPITGGGSNPATLPTTTNEYNWWGNEATVTEKSGSSTRTTTMTFDGAGRQTKASVTGGIGQAIPEATTEYDPVNGEVVKTTSASGGTITRTYDRLGRLTSYTDADGGVTTTQYDLLDRPAKVTDNSPSTVTFTYDTAAEPRGLATQTTDSVAGTFRATYDADGSVSSEKLPGGYTLTQTEDTAGTATERTYTRDSDGTLVYSDTITQSIHAQNTSHAGWSDQTYRYDGTGRLNTVEDTADTVCTRRAYGFDARTNRKSLTTAASAPGADCPTAGGTSTSHTYDSADRLVDAGYAYDLFGRTTTAPGNGTLGHYVNDLVHQQTADGKRQTWNLDSALRFRSWKVEAGSGSTWSLQQSKANHYDSDGDNPRWIVEDTATGVLTRNVDSASGDLAATTGKSGDIVLQLTTLHGDVALQLPLDAGEAPVALEADEYGNPRATQPDVRYSWLGGKQRSAETLTGLTLMGARLYNPASGRFLSTDPEFGGNANAYDYCYGQPLNCYDLDGRWAWLAVSAAAWACSKWCPGKTTRRIAGVVSYASGAGLVRGLAIRGGMRYLAKRSVKNSIHTKRGYRVDLRGKKPHYNKWGARPKGKGLGASYRRVRYRNKHMGFPHVQYFRGGKRYGKWAYRPGLRHVYGAWRSR